MNVLGLEPILATVIITVIGVGIQVGLGVLQSNTPFDPKKLVSSAIISVFTAFAIVAPIITAIPEGTDQLAQFSIFVGTIAAIAGIDQLVKNVGGAIILQKKEKKA